MIKRIIVLAGVFFIAICANVNAQQLKFEALKLCVNDTVVNAKGYKYAAFLDGERLMVPLRLASEALGLEVGWDAATSSATVTDSTQKLFIKANEASVRVDGVLEIIDLTREVTLKFAPVNIEGRIYVPIELFKEIYCDVGLKNDKAVINMRVAYPVEGAGTVKE